MFELNYYNQSNLWNENPEEYQVQLLADIISMIPQDTQSILDVGCGNGLITNFLPEAIHVVGVDPSEEALKTVNREKYVGSIINLPFADNSFDLVMANDVIEHLPDEIYLQGIAELFRVASRYVLIAVPHTEQLEKSFTKCADCGKVYHINHHQRSFREKELIDLCHKEWKVNEIRFSGDITRPPLDPIEPALIQQFQGYIVYDNSLCPICGSSKLVNNHNSQTQKIIGNLRSRCFYNQGQFINEHINRSEVIAFYRHQNTQEIKIAKSTHFEEKILSPLLVDFNNPLQQVKQGFVEGCFWSLFFDKNQPETSKNSSDAIHKQLFNNVIIYFPVIPDSGDKIVIKIATQKIDEIKINVVAHDDLNDKSIPITNCNYCGHGEFEFLVEQAWEINTYGSAVSIEVIGEASLENVEYIANRINYKAEFLLLKQGHNIISYNCLGYYRSWALFVNSSGYYPKPKWLYLDNLDCFYNLNYPKVSLEVLMVNLAKRITQLSNQLVQKESERSQAEQAYARASKFETFFFKNRERRISRVLVLSHMFPNSHQPNSGCFVAEQVKALRELEGLDVRVVSGQPFWCNTKNPVKFAKLLLQYGKALRSTNWFLHEGTPTLFVPYLVGKPLFPFRFHGFTYKLAIALLAKRIHKVFNFDLVHAHTSYLDGFAGLHLARQYKKPLVITEHTNPFSYLTSKQIIKQITKNSLHNANMVIGVSQSLTQEIINFLSDSSGYKINTISNGVDINLFHITELQSRNISNKKVLRLLCVTALEEYKNIFCLLKSFQLLRETLKQIDVKLTVVGGGSLEESIADWIAQNGLNDYISLLGRQSRYEVAKLMREDCDILVLPSRSETFGVVVIEALASGKPVVSTRCGGPESIITEPYLGELCENDNPLALALAIEKVWSNIEKYPAQIIRQFVVDNYSFERLADNLIKLYQNI
ncbi:glycosyltransferase [Nostoc sp. FACHB-190]|uniref:glycosyltransferase n=1 Tax=Nostoc sp. FACHB-190 TaxID=2692838 RepID=UPI0016857851|nr:glycosyltransferase [Nostoc sp. FACHB-190]MBD2297079.1 glycosyltransferase [Nostoc sp. FACHB-190]